MNLKDFTCFNFTLGVASTLYFTIVDPSCLISAFSVYFSWLMYHVNQTMVDPWDFDEPIIGDLDEY